MDIPHGKHSIDFINETLVVTLTGTFNDLAVERWTNEVKEIVSTYSGKPFKMLMDLSSTSGGTPEAFDVANRYNQWLNTQNLIAKAIIYSCKMNEAIEQKYVWAKEIQNIKTFNNRREAFDWLNEYGECVQLA